MESVYFDITQNKVELPEGNYEMLVRIKAEAADTVKMEVLNQDDTDEWNTVYSPGAINITCLKAFKEKLYAGTSDGKVYVSENGVSFSLAYDTSETEVHCMIEFEDCLYIGTGNSGKVFKFDEAAWLLEYDSSETDVFCFKEFYSGLYAGTGANGKIFRLKSDSWAEYVDLAEASVFALESYSDNLYAGTGANGKLERLIFGIAMPVLTTYDAPATAPTGLTWDGTNIWSCDTNTNKIYKHNADMTVNTEYAGLGTTITGLTYDGTVIWSCGIEAGAGKIWKHNADLTENTEYNAPHASITGLTWDGTNIWSCNSATNKIYKHDVNIVDLLDTYDSPGANPYGLAWDGGYIWSGDVSSDKIYKHNTDMTVDFSYSTLSTTITGLTWDDAHIWSCDSGSDKIYKHKLIGTVYDSTDTNIYALKSFGGVLYAGGDGGNIYETPDGDTWDTDYATGEAEIRSLFDLGDNLYAGTGSSAKLYSLNGVWSLNEDLGDTIIYCGEFFSSQYFIGTGADGNIYTYRNGIIAGEQKTLTTAYVLYKLPFSIISLDVDDTIRFKLTKDGAIADWINVDFICFVAV